MSEHASPSYQVIPLTAIKPSATNPRKTFDQAKLEQLAESIRSVGVLEPVLVRPQNGSYELVAGERRLRAAKLAALESIPAIVKELNDDVALETQTIENLQRDDLHALEEASGYLALMKTAKYDVQRIGDRIGRSAKYVYDRLKLLELIPKAQELFLAGKFTVGHAILLARLKPEEQKRAIDLEGQGYGSLDGLFQPEHSELPFEDEGRASKKKADPYAEVKAVSVREFEQWIHDAIRAEPAGVDAFLFPMTAAVLEAHAEDKLAAILITREYMAGDEVRHAGKERVYGVNAWKRADGQEKSKTCERSRIGFVACGPGQGEAFLVCINKDKCEVHYGAEIRARRKRQKETARGEAPAKKAKDDYAEEERKRREQREQEEAKIARYGKALPAMLAALAEKIVKEPAGPDGRLGKILLGRQSSYGHFQGIPSAARLVPVGASAEDLVRHLAFAEIRARAIQWNSMREFPAVLKSFGLDYGKLLNEAAPIEKPKVQTAAKPAKKKARK